MSDYDELRGEIDKLAMAIARMDSNPSTWLSWLTYLLAQLEQQSNDSHLAHKEEYQSLLRTLQDVIRNRLATGGW